MYQKISTGVRDNNNKMILKGRQYKVNYLFKKRPQNSRIFWHPRVGPSYNVPQMRTNNQGGGQTIFFYWDGNLRPQ